MNIFFTLGVGILGVLIGAGIDKRLEKAVKLGEKSIEQSDDKNGDAGSGGFGDSGPNPSENGEDVKENNDV